MVSFLVRNESTRVWSSWDWAVRVRSWPATWSYWRFRSSSWGTRAARRVRASRARSSLPWSRAALAWVWYLSAWAWTWAACSSMRFLAVATSATALRTFWSCSWSCW